MFATGRGLRAGVLAAALFLVPTVARAELPDPSSDGWFSWRVPAVETAPHWCCYEWSSGVAHRKGCDLDGRHGGYSSSGEYAGTPEQMQIYVLMHNGEPSKIRALSPRCSVTARSAIADLGVVSSGDSVEWLEHYAAPRTDISTDVLAAIASHEGDRSQRILVDVAQNDGDIENRKNALFWMGQIRGVESVSDIEGIARNDRIAEMREHAIFVLSQLPGERAVDALLAVVKDQDRQRQDRKQALFWLAQSESDRAFDYVEQLLIAK
jgi:hypothetical protein